GLGFRVWGLGFRVEGSGLRMQGLRLRVEVLRFRVEDLGLASRAVANSTCAAPLDSASAHVITNSASISRMPSALIG
ncbi:hypothetical protein T484DRAFT_1650094, partial [Baffinella frigidus]